MWPYLLLGVGIGIVLFTVFANFVRGEKSVRHSVDSPYGTSDPQFARSMGSLLGPPLQGGNRITELVNGDAIFPAMLDAIRAARETITFETFIYWSGRIGQEFADALSARARAGVKTLILLDWAGSAKMKPELVAQLKEAGCQVERYHAPRWHHLPRLNNRTHRKLLVVDGRIGFTGGVGIGDEWTGHAQDPGHWRDNHFRVEGPVVAQMQAVFMVNWTKARGTVEHAREFFPPLEPAGPHHAQMFHSSPDEGSENIRIMYLLSLAAARRTLLLAQAYFVPDNLVVEKLVDAARRGVAITILLPGDRTDTPLVRRASRSRWGPLLRAGIRIREYQPTNLHAKMMILDGLWSSVGSTNFDNRSFRLNDEANLNILDAGFAAQLTKTFEADLAQSRAITLTEWEARPALTRLLDRLCAVFRHQM
jgi:cardiolipin synthase